MPFASTLRVVIVDDQLTSRLLIRGGLQGSRHRQHRDGNQW
jgi:hypothetical protein